VRWWSCLSDKFGSRGIATAGMAVFGGSFIGLMVLRGARRRPTAESHHPATGSDECDCLPDRTSRVTFIGFVRAAVRAPALPLVLLRS
jgi:hypothetical protein